MSTAHKQHSQVTKLLATNVNVRPVPTPLSRVRKKNPKK